VSKVVYGQIKGKESDDIREIRKLLKSYVTRLENKDAAARTTKEWRIVARVLDRIFFFCYIGTIVVYSSVWNGCGPWVLRSLLTASLDVVRAWVVLSADAELLKTIVVSLFTIFPRDAGDHSHTFTIPTTAAAAPEDVDTEAVTVSDLSFVYDDYSNVVAYR